MDSIRKSEIWWRSRLHGLCVSKTHQKMLRTIAGQVLVRILQILMQGPNGTGTTKWTSNNPRCQGQSNRVGFLQFTGSGHKKKASEREKKTVAWRSYSSWGQNDFERNLQHISRLAMLSPSRGLHLLRRQSLRQRSCTNRRQTE